MDQIHPAAVQPPGVAPSAPRPAAPAPPAGAAAAATRRKLLEDAATKGYIVAPDHLPFPGLGHIRKDSHGYNWVPVDYVNDAVEK
jgi:hypothetical protein